VVAGGSVYVVLLDDGSGHGRVIALRSSDGFIRWTHRLPSRAESSPMLQAGRLYFGTEDGTVYSLRARSGRVVWTYHAHGAVKGSPTLVSGRLYFGDYGGHVQAVRAVDGHRIWDSGAGSGGTFYATAAFAFGRVYVGNTDGREYSFAAADGKLAWAKQTGSYVYSSAAVRDVPGLGPTVYFGSYDGHLYAVNARTGTVRWSYRSGGKISGSPTMIGNTVYVADLSRHVTIGVDALTGRRVFRRGDGAFDPAISDGKRLILTGTNSLTAYVPAGNGPPGGRPDAIPAPPPLRDPSPGCAPPARCGPAFQLR
jgi:outer membrane protein assembly factor BamB